MSDINDVIHFFESEIKLSKEKMDSEESCCFNGVCVGVEAMHELNDAHIRYCQDIIDRIKRNGL